MLLDAHSPKQGAAGTYKGGFGFYPPVAFLDRGDGTGEARSNVRPAICGQARCSWGGSSEAISYAVCSSGRGRRW